MSTKLVKVRSERTSRKYEIIWEIPNFREVCEVANAFLGQDKVISKFVLDTCYSSSNCPAKLSIELVNRFNQNSMRSDFPRQDSIIKLQWELQNILEGKAADEAVCIQLLIYKKDGENLSTLVSQQKVVLKPKEPRTIHLKQKDIATNIPQNGQLTLQIDLEQFEPHSFQFLPEVESLISEGASKCLEDFSNLLRSGLHSDFGVRLEGGACFKVHKAILAARSPVFGRMLESGMEECAREEVTVDDISSKTMEIVLQFIYSGKLDEKSITVDNAEELAYAADKYDLPLIKEAVNRLLHNFCVVENAMNLLKSSRLFELKTAEEQITQFINKNILGISKNNMNFEEI